MEAQAIRLARDEVLNSHRPQIQNFDLRPAGREAVCGGSVSVLFLYLAANGETSSLFQAIFQAQERGKESWLLYFWNETEGHLCLCLEGRVLGNFPGENEAAFAEDPAKALLHGCPGYFCSGQPLTPTPRILLFGGGHVSLAIARLARELDFRITVLDDRAEFVTGSRFPGCTCLTVADFNHLPDLAPDQNTYILIMTRGHQFDREVLSWALRQPARYLGMMGSRAKRDSVYRSVLDEGFSPSALERVHCPIGLSIGAETPEEIAVSVLAEMIQTRREKLEFLEKRG